MNVHVAPPPPSGPVPYAPAFSLELLKDMLRIRRLEEKCAELYGAGKIRGFLHLYIGEEAVAAGAMRALGPEDNVVATYREHGQALLRGVSMGSILAEMYGKREGCSRGRGGSMHLFDAATRFYGGNAIVGGDLPLAVGLGLASHLKKENRVTACFFGDGAARGRLDCDHVHAVHHLRRHVVALRLDVDVRLRFRALEPRAHGVEIVLADEEYRQLPELRKVQALMELAFGHRALAEETGGDPGLALHLFGERQPYRQR